MCDARRATTQCGEEGDDSGDAGTVLVVCGGCGKIVHRLVVLICHW